MSSKCRPVVGSSNKTACRAWRWLAALPAARVPPLGQKARELQALRLAARQRGTGWPSFTYSSPTSTMGCSARITSRSFAKIASAR